jgi:DNA-binding response OmpR family regulator
VTAVGTARDAEECLGRKWDAFIFDVALPDGCGLGVMRKARAAQPTAGALVISGLGRQEDIDAAEEMGARYLDKPFGPGPILRFLEECLPQIANRGGRDSKRPSAPRLPDFSDVGETAEGEASGLVPLPFPPEVASLVAAVKNSGAHASTAESEHAYQLSLLARSVSTGGKGGSEANIDGCARAAGVSRQMLQDFVTLTARWEPERVAEMLSMTDRSGRQITRAILLRVARGSSALRREFDELVAKRELDLDAFLAELEQARGLPRR